MVLEVIQLMRTNIFLAEQCPLKDHKGAIRMKGLERTADGRCKIGSQFMIWVGDLEYKEYRYTLVFGKVVEGFDQLQDVSRIKAVQKSPTSWVLRQNVVIVDCLYSGNMLKDLI